MIEVSMTPKRINWQGNPDFLGWYGPPQPDEEPAPSNRHPQHPQDSAATIAASLSIEVSHDGRL